MSRTDVGNVPDAPLKPPGFNVDERLRELRERGDCDLPALPTVSPAFIPIPPHRVGVAHLCLKRRFLLADPTGCGKTPQAIVAFALLKEKTPALRLIVVTEKAALFQWRDAIRKFTPSLSAAVVGYSSEKVHLKPGERHQWYASETPDVWITTYHTMARDIDLMLEWSGSFVLVFDEVQKLRSRKQTLLYPAARRLTMKALGTWGLSATPIMNRVEDLYAIMESIVPGFWGSWTAFAEAYLDRKLVTMGGNRFWKVKGPKNLPGLMARMQPFYLKRPAAEIDKHLPPVVTQDYEVEMSAAQAEVYETILDQWFPDPDSERGKSLHKLTSLIYAQMIADAPTTLGHHGIVGAKELGLLDYLSDLDDDARVVIYSRFETVVRHLAGVLAHHGYRTGTISGEQNAREREAARTAFMDGSLRLLLITSAGGQALDLQAAGILIMFDLPWSYGEYVQVVGRARRIGSPHEKILIVHMIATAPDLLEGSIDTYTKNLLEEKEAIVQNTVGTPDEAILLVPDAGTVETLFDRVRRSRRGTL